MKILITGGAGFIGAHVAATLLTQGHAVSIIDDFDDRYDPGLKEARLAHLVTNAWPTTPVFRVDIRERHKVQEIFETGQFDQVVHLAAWAAVQPSMKDPHTYTSVNVDGTVAILEAARLTSVKNLVIASSSSVYGGLTQLPFREDMAVNQPISPYAATKVATEIMAATWTKMYGLPTTCLRFFTVYGPWGRPEMALFKFAEAIRQDQVIEMRGHLTQRDFTYIDDIVQGIIAALNHPQEAAIFNLGENQAVALPTVIELIAQALGKTPHIKEVPLPPGDIPATLADITQAQTKLHYQPTTSIAAGIKQFMTWYQAWYVPYVETKPKAFQSTISPTVPSASAVR